MKLVRGLTGKKKFYLRTKGSEVVALKALTKTQFQFSPGREEKSVDLIFIDQGLGSDMNGQSTILKHLVVGEKSLTCHLIVLFESGKPNKLLYETSLKRPSFCCKKHISLTSTYFTVLIS